MKNKLYFLILLLLFATNTFAGITCSNPKDECIEQGETRFLGPGKDTPFTLPCWKYRTTYDCKADADNNCKSMASEGCSPSAVSCKESWAGICAVKEVIYDCRAQKCEPKVVCNQTSGFCMKGDCMRQERSKDKDMQKALAALSALGAASKDFNGIDIFKGKRGYCSINIFDGITKNCCDPNPSGFLEGKVLTCKDEETETAKKNYAGLAYEIGERCNNKVAGICTSTHKIYCVFGSKLARMIQVAAVNQRIRPSFGSTQDPNCNGLTPEELQAIDFSKIEFSEFYADIDKEQLKTVGARNPDNVKKIVADKLEGLKEKLKQDAAKQLTRADELIVGK